MTIDDLAATVAKRILAEHELARLVLETRELIRHAYHVDGLAAQRIGRDTVKLLTAAGFGEAQVRGMGLSEPSIRAVVGRRATPVISGPADHDGYDYADGDEDN